MHRMTTGELFREMDSEVRYFLLIFCRRVSEFMALSICEHKLQLRGVADSKVYLLPAIKNQAQLTSGHNKHALTWFP